MKVDLIAKKRIGSTVPGGSLRVPRAQARALVAIGLADYAPAREVAKQMWPEQPAAVKRTYKRRDMTSYRTKVDDVET